MTQKHVIYPNLCYLPDVCHLLDLGKFVTIIRIYDIFQILVYNTYSTYVYTKIALA